MDRKKPEKQHCLIHRHMLSKGHFQTMGAELVPSEICILWSCLIAKSVSESRILFFPLEVFNNFVLTRTIKLDAFPSKGDVVIRLSIRDCCLYAFNFKYSWN